MIGQKNLIAKLKSYSIESLPHSIMLTGEPGSEQEDVCKEVASYYGLEMISLEDVSEDVISDINASHVQRLYVIDSSTLSVNSQNKLLKLFEEPTDYAYIAIISYNDSLVLDTIKTRSYSFKMDTYTRDMLTPLCTKEPDLALSLCTTPGQIETANHQDLRKMSDLCFKLSYMLDKMSFYEVITMSNLVNFKDQYDKYDISLFIKCFKKWFKDNANVYKIISHYESLMWSMNDKMDGKQRWFDRMMLEAWEASVQDDESMV